MELGADEVHAVVAKSAISAVNLAEVSAKLADHSMTDSVIEKVLRIGFDTLEFGPAEANLVPRLRRASNRYGLSLGDRCCLATALANQCPVLTADRAWARIRMDGLKVRVIGERR